MANTNAPLHPEKSMWIDAICGANIITLALVELLHESLIVENSRGTWIWHPKGLEKLNEDQLRTLYAYLKEYPYLQEGQPYEAYEKIHNRFILQIGENLESYGVLSAEGKAWLEKTKRPQASEINRTHEHARMHAH